MSKLNWFDWLTLILVIIGGLNWGLMSINMDWNVVALIFGATSIWTTIVYALVGLSALYLVFLVGRLDKKTRM